MESEAIKQFKPDINRASRHTQFKYFIYHYINPEGYIEFGYSRNILKNRKDKQILSEHLNHYAARSYLKYLQREYGLCEKLVGLNQGPGPCFDYGILKCKGACIHEELPALYNERAIEATANIDKINPSNILLIDKGRHLEEQALILIKDGRYYGYDYFDTDQSFQTPAAVIDLIPNKKYYPEQNTILKRFLDKPNGIRVISF
jgi:DNA polymerase-3 subunit epsilon